MKKVISVMVGLAFLASGCAATNTSDYDSYSKSYDTHQKSKNTAIVSLTTTAANAMQGITDPVAKVLYQIITQQQIVAISEQRFDLVKPTTMWDFWSGLWPFLGQSAPIFGMGYVAHEGLQAAGKNNYVTADSITDSFNPVENHITGSSQSSIGMDFSKPYNIYQGPVTQ